ASPRTRSPRAMSAPPSCWLVLRRQEPEQAGLYLADADQPRLPAVDRVRPRPEPLGELHLRQPEPPPEPPQRLARHRLAPAAARSLHQHATLQEVESPGQAPG